MPLVLSTNKVHDLATGRCRSCPKNFRDTCYKMRTVCVSLYINTKHLHDVYTSGYDVYGGAAWGHHTRVTHYSSSLVFYTSSFPFPWDCSHLFPSKTYALPSHGGIRLSSLRFTRSGYPSLSRGLLLRASSSQNGPPALWWKANRLPRGSGSLDRYMLIAA